MAESKPKPKPKHTEAEAREVFANRLLDAKFAIVKKAKPAE